MPVKKTQKPSVLSKDDKKVGRPSSEEPRESFFVLRLAPNERDILNNSARNIGLDTSSFLRFSALYVGTSEINEMARAYVKDYGSSKEVLYMALTEAERTRIEEKKVATGLRSLNEFFRVAATVLMWRLAGKVEPLPALNAQPKKAKKVTDKATDPKTVKPTKKSVPNKNN